MAIDRCRLTCSSGTPSCFRRSRASSSSFANSASISAGSAASARRRNIADRSWRMSTSRQPSADVMPGLGGTITVGIDSSCASAAPCSGPAPPKATSAKSRGS